MQIRHPVEGSATVHSARYYHQPSKTARLVFDKVPVGDIALSIYGDRKLRQSLSHRPQVRTGGGFGRVFRMGEQPVNASIAGYYNAIRPTGTPAWQLRASIALLFPAK